MNAMKVATPATTMATVIVPIPKETARQRDGGRERERATEIIDGIVEFRQP